MILTSDMLEQLTILGLHIDGHLRNITDDLICEIPCSLKATEVHAQVKFGAYSYMVSGYIFATTVGRYCSIAENVQIGRQNHPLDWVSTSPYFYIPSHDIQPVFPSFENQLRMGYYQHGAPATTIQHTIIGHNVWIGHAAILKAGITVGNGSIIAAGSVVTKDVEPYSIVGGNPAKFIRYRISKNLIEPLEKIKWWDYSPKQLERFQMHNIDKFIDAFIDAFNASELEKQSIRVIHLNSFNFTSKDHL